MAHIVLHMKVKPTDNPKLHFREPIENLKRMFRGLELIKQNQKLIHLNPVPEGLRGECRH